jgi:hypothetical protein
MASLPTVPAPTPAPETQPTGPTAVVEQTRDLVSEREKERKEDKAIAEKKKNRFTSRSMIPTHGTITLEPAFENLLFKSAANAPLSTISRFSQSSFIPNFSTCFYVLGFMDQLMASTKRWTDNCMGWVPPISQAYVAVICHVQVLRAMNSAGLILPGSESFNFLKTFVETFPLNELWIPGPLVGFFRNLSSFWPSEDDTFGSVSPTTPPTPDWTRARHFRLGPYQARNEIVHMFPNISLYFTRLRSICATATAANMTQATFSNHINGPNHIKTVFGRQVDNDVSEVLLTRTPGAMYAYPDNLSLWINASSNIPRLAIPLDLVDAAVNPTIPTNEWSAFLRFSQNPNEHVWFAPVAAVMAKYCQFFNGSNNLDNIAPNCSPAPAIKQVATGLDTLNVAPTWIARSGTGASDAHGDTNAEAHYQLRFSGTRSFTPTLALRDVPELYVQAALTFNHNLMPTVETVTAYRAGPFWTLGPDIQERQATEVLSGVLPIIAREYHSDVRIPAHKQ